MFHSPGSGFHNEDGCIAIFQRKKLVKKWQTIIDNIHFKMYTNKIRSDL